MKTMKYLSMMLAMLTMSVCMFGCGNDDDDIPETIIGHWTQTNSTRVITLTFNSNKTGKINYTYSDGSGDINENFEYEYIETDRSLTIINSQLNGEYDVVLTATTLRLKIKGSKEGYDFTKIK